MLQGDNEFAILTAFRDEFSKKQNLSRNKILASKLKSEGYGYFYVDGYWVENKGKDNEVKVSEDSIFVINNDNKPEFFDLIIKLGKTYNQDGVFIKNKNGAKVYNQSGNVVFDAGKFNPNKTGEFYTKLRTSKKSNPRTFMFEGIRLGLTNMGKYIQLKENKWIRN